MPIRVLCPPGEHRLCVAEDPGRVLDFCAPGRVRAEVVAAPGAVAELDVGTVVETPYGEVVPLEMPVPRPVEGASGKAQIPPVELPGRRGAPPWGIASFEESSQCQPVALRGDLETESLANSREEVDVLGEGVDNPPASRARPGARTMPGTL